MLVAVSSEKKHLQDSKRPEHRRLAESESPGFDRANSESSTISPNSCYMSMSLGRFGGAFRGFVGSFFAEREGLKQGCVKDGL